MRCKWKEVRNQEKLVEICDRFGRWFLEFSDYSLTLILHEVCGFGQAKRLPDLMDSINPRLNEQMRIYMEDDEEDLWEVTQTTYFGLLRQIRELVGWDPETVTAEYPVRDLFKPIFGTEKESDRHIFRQNFVGTMEKKIGVYWYMVLRYLIDERRFGAVRLERVFRRMRQDYVSFAELFLKSSSGGDKDLHRMIGNLKKRAARLGIQYDYGNGPVPVRKDAKDETDEKSSISHAEGAGGESEKKTGVRPAAHGVQNGGMVCQNKGSDVSGFGNAVLPGVPAWHEYRRIGEVDTLPYLSAAVSGRSGKTG